MKADHHVILVFMALDVFAHFDQSLIQAEALQQGQHQSPSQVQTIPSEVS